MPDGKTGRDEAARCKLKTTSPQQVDGGQDPSPDAAAGARPCWDASKTGSVRTEDSLSSALPIRRAIDTPLLEDRLCSPKVMTRRRSRGGGSVDVSAHGWLGPNHVLNLEISQQSVATLLSPKGSNIQVVAYLASYLPAPLHR